MLFRSICQPVQLNCPHDAATAFYSVGGFPEGGLIAGGRGEAHVRDSGLSIVDAERIKLVELRGGHGGSQTLIDGLVQTIRGVARRGLICGRSI